MARARPWPRPILRAALPTALLILLLMPAGRALAAADESKVLDPVPLLELTNASGARLYTLSTSEANRAVSRRQNGLPLL